MPIEDSPFDVGGEEIGKSQNDKQQHCQHIGQTLAYISDIPYHIETQITISLQI
jgi:hypothetical protein